MKRLTNVWSKITDFENIFLAYEKAKRGKRKREEVAKFSLNLEYKLIQLQTELQQQTYKPGKYRQFTLYERKPRLISAAPFRDRVVHHALMNIVEPWFDKSFIYDSYACRKNKGTHKAVTRYQIWSKRYAYALKLDIAKYFPSIDLLILKQQIEAKIKDKQVLWLFNRIIDHQPPFIKHPPIWFPGDDLLTPLERKKGIPIGNLTSQVCANLYLNSLDHYIKEKLQVKAYLRYVDDMILLSNHKSKLHQWNIAIEKYLQSLRLKLHPKKVNIFPTYLGVDVLGYRVFPYYRLLRNDNGYRFHRKLRQFAKNYASGKMAWDDFKPSIRSWIGHAKQADTKKLCNKIFYSVLFKREQS